MVRIEIYCKKTSIGDNVCFVWLFMSSWIERKYVVPVRSVKSVNDMAFWEKSTAYYDIIGFINAISQAIQGKKLTTKLDPSPIADSILHIFDELNKMVDETPPLDQPQRFGNKAYRDWFEKMKAKSPELLKEALPAEFHPALIEITEYLTESFGNATRIDYGTGHELAFIMFLCALYKIHALNESDNLHVGLKIFNAYLLFVRRLQLTYRMEPAGSHGVWSLDDYQYVPFIWGSAQLAVNAPFEPHHFLEPDIIDRYKNDYYWIGCIDYILQVGYEKKDWDLTINHVYVLQLMAIYQFSWIGQDWQLCRTLKSTVEHKQCWFVGQN